LSNLFLPLRYTRRGVWAGCHFILSFRKRKKKTPPQHPLPFASATSGKKAQDRRADGFLSYQLNPPFFSVPKVHLNGLLGRGGKKKKTSSSSPLPSHQLFEGRIPLKKKGGFLFPGLRSQNRTGLPVHGKKGNGPTGGGKGEQPSSKSRKGGKVKVTSHDRQRSMYLLSSVLEEPRGPRTRNTERGTVQSLLYLKLRTRGWKKEKPFIFSSLIQRGTRPIYSCRRGAFQAVDPSQAHRPLHLASSSHSPKNCETRGVKGEKGGVSDDSFLTAKREKGRERQKGSITYRAHFHAMH